MTALPILSSLFILHKHIYAPSIAIILVAMSHLVVIYSIKITKKKSSILQTERRLLLDDISSLVTISLIFKLVMPVTEFYRYLIIAVIFMIISTFAQIKLQINTVADIAPGARRSAEQFLKEKFSINSSASVAAISLFTE
ncbi:hypothetical protein CES87_16175 [Pseudomonas sp. ERMR1:02]|nr:hypothetical protein CES87_16175 [Pseudomonas sp. ERMR1:02]